MNLKEEIRKIIYDHTSKVDNWNDAIFDYEFDSLVYEIEKLVNSLKKIKI